MTDQEKKEMWGHISFNGKVIVDGYGVAFGLGMFAALALAAIAKWIF